ncbi:MAG: hypothetical protein IKA49_02665 [Alistipes sp.]|nr:hypothetical protein [Alistipes sp.]
MTTFATNILSTEGVLTLSPGSSRRKDNIFAENTPEYNEGTGFCEIKNPGWVEIRLKTPQQISYLRFLLWDNRGTEKKRQPSNRKYTYRLLIAEEANNRQGVSNGESIVWTALYENSLNPSNGWQEFFFEDGAKSVVAIKIQFFQNTSASQVHKNFTQLVSVQAYKSPTYAIKQLLDENKEVAEEVEYAPMPTYGFIRNRVIIGGEQEAINDLVEDEIVKEVTDYIRSEGEGVPELDYLCKELEHTAGDRCIANNDVEKQIRIFNRSILKPIESYDKRLSKRFRIYTFAAIILFGFGIIKEVVDIICLYNGANSPLSVKYILDWIFN